MTFGELQNIIKDNNIPEDVHLTSDSGWECNATEMDGVYYNETLNEIVFTQDSFGDYHYDGDDAWKKIKKADYSNREGLKCMEMNKKS